MATIYNRTNEQDEKHGIQLIMIISGLSFYHTHARNPGRQGGTHLVIEGQNDMKSLYLPQQF